MDIYSFGLLCLWVLFPDFLDQSTAPGNGLGGAPCFVLNEDSDPEHVKTIKVKDMLPQILKSLIENEVGFDQEQRERLTDFFKSTLRIDPQFRESSFKKLKQMLNLTL
jgi:hypothetical protein